MEDEQDLTPEWVIDETTNAEYIVAMANAVAVADSIDAITKVDQERVRRIKRMALRIVDKCVDDISKDFFDNEEE